MVERQPLKLFVVGSSPTIPSISFRVNRIMKLLNIQNRPYYVLQIMITKKLIPNDLVSINAQLKDIESWTENDFKTFNTLHSEK